LFTVVEALGGEMLAIGKLTKDAANGRKKIAAAIENGAAAEVFARMVAALGGPSDFIERADYLPTAPIIVPVLAGRHGRITRIDTRLVGLTVLALGGGRTRADQSIDSRVGVSELLGRSTTVIPETPLCFVHAADQSQAEAAQIALAQAYSIEQAPAVERDPILEKVQ
jgi:thymidine phosphorylase